MTSSPVSIPPLLGQTSIPSSSSFLVLIRLRRTAAMAVARKPPCVSLQLLFLCFLLSLPAAALAECECTPEDDAGADKHEALKLKYVGIGAILFSGAMGVLIPVLGRRWPALGPEKDAFFVMKAFAAGVILATGMIHVLPDAFESLSSPCLPESPWHKFPFAGFVAMMSALVTLMIDTCATSYYQRVHFSKAPPVAADRADNDEEAAGDAGGNHAGHIQLHTNVANCGHVHGAALSTLLHGEQSLPEHIRHRVVSQVLELGIVVHSVIIGISVGASVHPSTVRPLVGALSFHQFFEGIGLGGCIVQAKFKARETFLMALFFSLTTPVGIAVGIAITSRPVRREQHHCPLGGGSPRLGVGWHLGLYGPRRPVSCRLHEPPDAEQCEAAVGGLRCTPPRCWLNVRHRKMGIRGNTFCVHRKITVPFFSFSKLQT